SMRVFYESIKLYHFCLSLKTFLQTVARPSQIFLFLYLPSAIQERWGSGTRWSNCWAVLEL
ncbi:hypothetical protein, partial [Gluconobacter sp.]|uniref:hypothetical protein n=1 Tax=Gluconobacter sp. TaxID=1876758 RepID=UPI0039E98D28